MSLYKMISSKILENSQGTFWKINLASSLLLFAQYMLSTLCNVLVDPFPLHHKQVEDGQLGLVHEVGLGHMCTDHFLLNGLLSLSICYRFFTAAMMLVILLTVNHVTWL